ncbi:polysaccharide deacetylase family protein [Halobiforma nitratireducens]|uniref:Polysaccharide deacetylase n=1 Tax=Halobiforma nitratireducens JCM 10879 TaxID=1227454 RepID=M0LVP7_9EURY|nr:polysaccharide deacetylase family protein [Halobiforma nitratireducens]EMA37238.1 polysaccharide deacetylase [Halobiforma nitratireducens JCM 10879]
MKRRTYLTTTTATAVGLAFAGCMSDEADEDDPGDVDGEDDDYEDEEDDTEETETEQEEEEDEDDEATSDIFGTFDDFENLEPWMAFQDIGSVEADSDQYYEGSQCARLEPDEEEGQVRIRRSLDEPIDVRDAVPGLAVASDERGMVRIQLQDEDGDYVEYSQQVMNDVSLTRVNFGLTRIRGDPDLSEIHVLQIIRWFGDDASGRMWVDDFHFVPNTDTGKVMLQFHGGYESHYTEAMPILREYDLPATTFVPTDRLRADVAVQGDRLTYDQVGELADAGWTIGSQSAQGVHLGRVSSNEMESNVTNPIDWLEEEGYEDGARFFAYPGSEYTQESYDLVEENYDLAFAGQAESQGYAANPYLCSLVADPDPDEAVNLLEWTAQNGGITSLAFYELEDEGSIAAVEEAAARLDQLVEQGDLEVITPQEMADEYVYTD